MTYNKKTGKEKILLSSFLDQIRFMELLYCLIYVYLQILPSCYRHNHHRIALLPFLSLLITRLSKNLLVAKLIENFYTIISVYGHHRLCLFSLLVVFGQLNHR